MIENSQKKDYPYIVEIGKLINNNFANLYPESSLYNEYTKVIVYKINGEICAFLQYEISPDTISIINLVVKPEYRRKNIASLLIDYLLSDICNKNYKNIILEVKEDNYPAINLYTKFNFEVINIRKKYYSDKDGYVMERRI